MQELKCPECGHLNPDIRELGYTLPWTCGNCPHIWRLQDVMPTQKPMPPDMAKVLLDGLWDLYATDEDSNPPNTELSGDAPQAQRPA